MGQFIVHSVPGSPYGRAVLATLIEKGADFGFNPVAPDQTKVEPHISRHPFGRVPSIQHDGFPLYETQAIMRYIDRVLPEPALTPADARAAALMDQVLNIADWYLFQGVNSVIAFQRIVGPQLLGLATDLAAIEAAMPQGIKVFDELSRLLGDKPYFLGDDLTLADLSVAAQVDFLASTPEWTRLTEGRVNIVAWLDRMRERPSMAGTTWPRVSEMAAMAAA